MKGTFRSKREYQLHRGLSMYLANKAPIKLCLPGENAKVGVVVRDYKEDGERQHWASQTNSLAIEGQLHLM